MRWRRNRELGKMGGRREEGRKIEGGSWSGREQKYVMVAKGPGRLEGEGEIL